MKIKEFINGRNVTYQTVRKYIKSHPELFNGHIGRKNNIVLDETAIEILEDKYPIATQIVENTEEITELRIQLLKAQDLIINLQQQVVEAAPLIAKAQQNEKLLQQSTEEIEALKKQLDEEKKRKITFSEYWQRRK